jgi:hypothetical protein
MNPNESIRKRRGWRAKSYGSLPCVGCWAAARGHGYFRKGCPTNLGHRCFGARCLQPVLGRGFGCRYFSQRGQEALPTAASGHLFHARPTSKLLRQRCCDDALHRNILACSHFSNLAIHCVGNCHVQSHGVLPIIARNCGAAIGLRPIITRSPKSRAGLKSPAGTLKRAPRAAAIIVRSPNSRAGRSGSAGARSHCCGRLACSMAI